MTQFHTALREYLRVVNETDEQFSALKQDAMRSVINTLPPHECTKSTTGECVTCGKIEKLYNNFPNTLPELNPYCSRCITNVLTDAQLLYCKNNNLPNLCFNCQKKYILEKGVDGISGEEEVGALGTILKEVKV